MQIINDAYDKYSEHFEQAGDQSPLLMNHLLAQMVMKEREENTYLKSRLDENSRRVGTRHA